MKAIEKSAEEQSDDPFLVVVAERAKADLFLEIEKHTKRKQEQAEKALDGLSYFVLCKLTDDGIPNAEKVSVKIREVFAKHPGWKDGEAELRELRNQVTFAVYDEEEDLDKVAAAAESLFSLLNKAFKKQ